MLLLSWEDAIEEEQEEHELILFNFSLKCIDDPTSTMKVFFSIYIYILVL